MIELLITLVPSLCWIFYRIIQILRTPVEDLVTDMQIEIPHTPRICIDSITINSAVLHWDIEIRANENLYYVLVINNQEVATLVSTSCKLNNLSVGNVYEIQIIAINSISNFKSESIPIFIEPSGGEGLSRGMFDEEVGGFHGENQESPEPPKFLPQEKTKSPDSQHEKIASESTELHDPIPISEKSTVHFQELPVGDLERASKHPNPTIENLTTDDVEHLSSSQLNSLLISFQNEIIKQSLEYKSYQQHSELEIEKLTETYAKYKKEFTEENDNRQRKESGVKILEKLKNELTYEKLKLTNQLQKVRGDVGAFTTKLNQLEDKIQRIIQRNEAALTSEEDLKKKIVEEITNGNITIVTLKNENERIEENLKLTIIERKKLAGIIREIKPIVEEFSPGEAPIQPILQIVPDWEDEISKELEQYLQLEASWKEAYKAAIQKYISVHNSVEMNKHERDPTYPLVKLTEYQASIDFGGFSNAISKKIRHRDRNHKYKDDDSKVDDREENYFNHYSHVYADDEEAQNEKFIHGEQFAQNEQYQGENFNQSELQGEQFTQNNGLFNHDGQYQEMYRDNQYQDSQFNHDSQYQNQSYNQSEFDGQFSGEPIQHNDLASFNQSTFEFGQPNYSSYEFQTSLYDRPKLSVPPSLAAQLPSQMSNSYLYGLGNDLSDLYGYDQPQPQPLLNYGEMGSLFYNSPSVANATLNSGSLQASQLQNQLQGTVQSPQNLQGGLLQGNLQSQVMDNQNSYQGLQSNLQNNLQSNLSLQNQQGLNLQNQQGLNLQNQQGLNLQNQQGLNLPSQLGLNLPSQGINTLQQLSNLNNLQNNLNNFNMSNGGLWGGLYSLQSVSSLQADAALQSSTNLQNTLGKPFLLSSSNLSPHLNVASNAPSNLNPSASIPSITTTSVLSPSISNNVLSLGSLIPGSPTLSPTPSMLASISPRPGNLQINSSMLGTFKHSHSNSRGYNLWVDNKLNQQHTGPGLDPETPSQLWRSDSLMSTNRAASPALPSEAKNDFQPFSNDINLGQ